MDLLSILGEDVCSFERIQLPLHQQGLVWVGGTNLDSEAAKSNGSGKSNIFKLISWTMYGETIDGDEGDAMIRLGTKCARGTLECLDGETQWLIIRERRKGAPRLYLQRDGVAQAGSRVELQARINTLFGLDFPAFRNTALYGQRDLKRFVEPSVSDADRKEVLQRILRTSIFGTCHDWVKEQKTELKKQSDALLEGIAKHSARLEEIDLPALETEAAEWGDKRRARVATARSRIKTLTEEAKELRATAPLLAPIETSLAKLREVRVEVEVLADAIESLDEAVSKCQAVFLDAEVNRKTTERARLDLDERLTALEGEDTCPTCGSGLHEGAAHDHIAKMRADFASADEAWNDAVDAVSKARAMGADANRKRVAALAAGRQLRVIDNDIAVKLDELSEAREHDQRVDNAVIAAQAAVAEVKAIAAESNPHTARLETAKARVDELERKREQEQIELDEVNNERAHYEFWMRGFGPTGLPSFALDKWMPYLTERANHYLEVLADGDITMTFATQRELKSGKGEYRDQISIRWCVEGVADYPPSGGQFKKMSVATDFALMDLACSREGAHIDLLCLDECLDGLDVEGRQRVLQLLHSLRSKRGTILVISHESDVAEVFERAINVVKQDGVSRLEE